MLLVLFGVPGSGKSFVGNILQEDFGFFHYEADDDLTPPIIDAIINNQSVSAEMRAVFFKRVCEHLRQLAREF